MVEQVEQNENTNNGDEKKGAKRNFIMICLAYVCSYTSLNAVISLQSSINTDANIGLYSLAIMYGSSLITSLFFTTPIGYIFGYKWSIVSGQFGAMIYVASNMYPKQWLMFSTAVICGIFRACMFMAQEAYVSILAGGGSEDDDNDDDDNDTKNRKYFSIFFSAYQSAEIWGNLISYIVLRNVLTTAETNLEQCGANFLEKEHEDQQENGHISSTITYILFSIFAGVIMISVILVIFFLNQKRDIKIKRKYSRPACFVVAALLSYTVFIVMLIWKPASSQIYVLFILPCLSSISTGITEPFITAMYNSVFPGKKDTAFSLLTFAQTASCLALLLYASVLRVRIQIILQLIFLTLAMLSYIIISIKQYRSSNNNNDEQQISVLNDLVMIPSISERI
ncbi:unnamed protein product [Adineta steineri]|uniref:Uncharacterized protein n=1 Tax=Adineta steineri TaxID=433720 RepID=A0A819WGE8_9BILA|nr:unnamed protein product [Adineta steineri]